MNTADMLPAKKADGGHPGRLKKAGLDLLIAIPIFVFFVFAVKIGGYDLLTLRPRLLIPPIPVYLADYSLTFTTKLLIGSVTRLFAEKITLEQMYAVCSVANIAAVGALSLFGAAILRSAIELKQYAAVILCSFFALNAMLPLEYYPSFGSYNTYWTILFVFLIFLCGGKAFYLLAPIICVVGMLVHDGFFFAFLPAVMAIIVYDHCSAQNGKQKKLSAASFLVTGAASGALLIYSSFFQNKYLNMTAEEFHAYMISRFDISFGEQKILERNFGPSLFPFSFFETYFFDQFSDAASKAPMTPFGYIAAARAYLSGRVSSGFYLRYLAVFLPFVLMFAVLWGLCAKKSSGIKKVPFILFALIPFSILPLVVVSTDFHRWIPAVMISQFSLVFAMLKKKDAAFSEVMSSPLLKKKIFAVLMIAAAGICIAALTLYCRDLPMIDDVA